MNNRKFVTILIVFFCCVFAFIGAYIYRGVQNGEISFDRSGRNKERMINTSNYSEHAGKWQEGNVRYNGELYRYNANCRTYLIMGVDKDGKVEKAADYLSGGQSDAIFLLVTDSKNKKISVIPVNRNTITRIEMFDVNGNSLGYHDGQLCLQHGYGDGMHESCRKTVEAVQYMFYDIPIYGYMAMNMDAIYLLNGFAEGVPVEVMNDIDYERLGVHLRQGETKTLSNEEAYAYVRYRDINEFGSANLRLEREKQYAYALYDRIAQIVGEDAEKAVSMYEQINEYMVTNIEFSDIVEDLIEYGFDESRVFTIEGETKKNSEFEEFFVDKNSLYDIIIKVLYEKV